MIHNKDPLALPTAMLREHGVIIRYLMTCPTRPQEPKDCCDFFGFSPLVPSNVDCSNMDATCPQTSHMKTHRWIQKTQN